jgi:glycosyltransferase involved in cell wall biosynthesis
MTDPAASDGGTVRAPTVSVVMPTYQRPTYLARAIESVLAQTFDDFEVIVVDDNDADTDFRDETRALMRHFESDGRVTTVEHPRNRGISAARNSGIAQARAPFIAFLDDDDAWLPEKLARQLEVFDSAARDVAVVTCGWTIRNESGQVIREERPRLRGRVLEHLALNRIGPPSAAVCRTDAVREIGGFDESLRYREDTDFYLRLAQHFRFDFVDMPLVDYLQHAGSVSRRTRNTIDAFDVFFAKHEKFLRASPARYSDYRERQGDLHAELDELRHARLRYRQAIATTPLRLRPYLKLAATALGARGYPKARAAYRRLLRRR